MRKFLGNADILSGIMFVGFGVGVAWISRNYPFGTLASMGPGFFPGTLAWLLVALGVLVMVNGVRNGDGNDPVAGAIDPRAITFVPASVVVFAITIDGLGLVLAAILVTAIGGLAFRGVRIVPLAVFSVALSAAMSLLFVVALGLQIRLWP